MKVRKLWFLESILKNNWINPRKLKLFLINIDTLVNYMNEKSPLNLIEDNKIQSYELDHQLFVDQFLRSSEYSSSRILFP